MRTLLLSIFLLNLTLAYAQRIDLQVGMALPNGEFGNSDIVKNENSFATSGYTVALQADYNIWKMFGLIGKLNYSTFGFNSGTYENQLNQNPASGTSVSIENNGGFSSTSAMVGGEMTLGKKRLTVDLRLMTGFLTLTDNGLTYTTTYSGQTYTQRIFSQKDAAIAFGWGLSARYLFSNNIYVSMNLDNVYANTSFNKNTYQSSSNESISKPYQSYLLAVGLGYSFD